MHIVGILLCMSINNQSQVCVHKINVNKICICAQTALPVGQLEHPMNNLSPSSPSTAKEHVQC